MIRQINSYVFDRERERRGEDSNAFDSFSIRYSKLSSKSQRKQNSQTEFIPLCANVCAYVKHSHCA